MVNVLFFFLFVRFIISQFFPLPVSLFSDICGYLVAVCETAMDDDRSLYGREVTIVLEDRGVLSFGLVF